MIFDSLVPIRLTLRANLRLLYLKGPAFSIVFFDSLRFDSFNRPSVRLKPYELKTSFLSR